ncbi:MAG: NAD(P)-dependent oxidoreductase [Bacilli bacterium]
MNVLVLGGDGYLGTRISHFFAEKDCFCYRSTVNLNLVGKEGPSFKFVSAKRNNLCELIINTKIDIIINTVAMYERKGIDKSSIISANAIFPLSIFPFAIEHGVKKILTIDTSLPKYFNFYSLTKSFAANIGELYSREDKSLFFADIVLENFYGPDEPRNRFLHNCVSLLKDDKPLELTVGTQHRDFIYVVDVIEALWTISQTNNRGFYRIPVGSGESPTIREVVEYLKEITCSKSVLNFGAVPQRYNEPSTKADLTMLNSFGYQIKYTWQKGMKDCFISSEKLCGGGN